MVFLSYAFIPLYSLVLIHSFEKREEKLKVFLSFNFKFNFANFIHSGASSLIVVISLSIISILTLYIFVIGNLKIIYKFIYSIIIGLAISSSKLMLLLHL